MACDRHFRNGKTFSSYCRSRYGQSKLIWEANNLWMKEGEYAIWFDQDAADKIFEVKNPNFNQEPKKHEIKNDLVNSELNMDVKI